VDRGWWLQYVVYSLNGAKWKVGGKKMNKNWTKVWKNSFMFRRTIVM